MAKSKSRNPKSAVELKIDRDSVVVSMFHYLSCGAGRVYYTSILHFEFKTEKQLQKNTMRAKTWQRPLVFAALNA